MLLFLWLLRSYLTGFIDWEPLGYGHKKLQHQNAHTHTVSQSVSRVKMRGQNEFLFFLLVGTQNFGFGLDYLLFGYFGFRLLAALSLVQAETLTLALAKKKR